MDAADRNGIAGMARLNGSALEAGPERARGVLPDGSACTVDASPLIRQVVARVRGEDDPLGESFELTLKVMQADRAVSWLIRSCIRAEKTWTLMRDPRDRGPALGFLRKGRDTYPCVLKARAKGGRVIAEVSTEHGVALRIRFDVTEARTWGHLLLGAANVASGALVSEV